MAVYINRAEVILLLRVRRMTQKEFAALTGLTEIYISMLLNKKASVGIGAQRKIQDALELKDAKGFEKLFIMVDK